MNVSIFREQYRVAQDYIYTARDMLDKELTAMAGESYQRAYGAMVQVQILSELEEVSKQTRILKTGYNILFSRLCNINWCLNAGLQYGPSGGSDCKPVKV